MIISASRRTDIPAFYSAWFMNRVRARFCEVPNPFNPKQVTKVSLAGEDVEAIVFWTRNPRPLMPHLDELEKLGYRFVFLYTLIAYPPPIEVRAPRLEPAIEAFLELAERVGPARVVWRYDPILFTPLTAPKAHLERFTKIAISLSGHTERCKISMADLYKKTHPRMAALAAEGLSALEASALPEGALEELLRGMATVAKDQGIRLESCAEELDLTPFGISPGKCIDDEHLRQALGVEVSAKKDPGQRKVCGCVKSRDIGMYDSCQFGCAYCYATADFTRSRRNFLTHDPEATTLLMTPRAERSG